MSGYRCVNYHELCRLCTSSSGTKIHIFSEEGKKLALYNKIIECLPVIVDEKDKLPKIICSQCLQQIEKITEFRETCINAQNMLESCLNTPKLRNGGKVYIKDVPKKQQTNTVTVTKAVGSSNNVGTTTQGSDFLSSIIQAVGIHNVDDVSEIPTATVTQTQPPPLQPQQTQYTLTFDGKTLKANPIQYKIEEPQQIFTISELEPKPNSQAALVQSVNEFLKLNNKKPTPVQDKTAEIYKRLPSSIKVTSIKKEPQQQTQPQQTQQQQHQQQQQPNINFVLTSPKQITKQVPQQQTVQPQTHQIILPIQFKKDPSGEHQIITQSDGKSLVLPYLQMKLPSNFAQVDGQKIQLLGPTNIQLQSTPTIQQSQTQTNVQPSIAYTTSNNASNLTPSFRITTNNSQNQNQQVQTVTIPAGGLQLTTIPTQTQTLPNTIQIQGIKTEPSTQQAQTQPQITIKQHKVQTQSQNQQTQQQQQQQQQQIQTSQTVTTVTQIPVSMSNVDTKPDVEFVSATPPSSSVVITSGTSTSTTTATTTNTPQPVKCNQCGKIFKRKEHLVQHLKLHIGLRPFKCTETGCNKAFSRKEHLMRHLVSHTGKKMFSCDLCQKLFSRKDNLNKHKRTHPEYVSTTALKTQTTNKVTTTTAGSNNSPANTYVCEVCSKVFAVKHYFMEHKKLHDNEDVIIKEEKPEPTIKAPPVKKQKQTQKKRASNTEDEIKNTQQKTVVGQIIETKPKIVISDPISLAPAALQQAQITTQQVQQQTQQQQQQGQQQQQTQIVQIRLAPSMTGQNNGNKNQVLTLPTSLANIVSLNGNFLTGEMIQNYKIDI